MTVNHGVLGSSPCSGADARGLCKVLCRTRLQKGGLNEMKNFQRKIWSSKKKELPLQSQAILRELSSAGSERLPYKQRVGGSNPSAPTKSKIG